MIDSTTLQNNAIMSGELTHRERRGRPRGEQTVPTSVKIHEGVYDDVCRLARRDRASVHAVIRKAIESYVKVRLNR